MSICIQQNNFEAHHGNFSQNLSECEKTLQLPVTNHSKWNVIKQYKFWNARIVQRRALARLDERLLADIGYSAQQAREEIIKPFWK